MLKQLLKRALGRAHPIVDKDAWIRQYVPGLTFADIGGLWGTVNEKVTVAMRAGASGATMIDFQPPGSKWWRLFDEHCASMQLTGYRSMRGDICMPYAVKRMGQFDFVHCSGILYHAPDVFTFLRNLYEMSRRYLVLTSIVVPDLVWNRRGMVRIPPGTLLSVPALPERDKAVIGRYFDKLGTVPIRGINAEAEPAWMTPGGRFRTGPWWWLFSPTTMRRMVQVLPFDVLADGYSWGKRSYSLLLRANHPPSTP